jgi:hypothetical protein
MNVATRLGATLVLAAGNNGSPHAMGNRVDVLSVAATDADDAITRFSNRGDYVDVAAPGQFIATTSLLKELGADSIALRRPDYTRGASGTSFSAPVAAGAVALLQAWRRQNGLPWLSPRDVILRLSDTADDISDANPGVEGYGSGRLNFLRMLTDPRTSFSWPQTLIASGSPAILPTSSGAARIACATTDSRLVVVDGSTGAVVHSVDLPSRPNGSVAAADLGDGRGVGLFVAMVDGRIFACDERCVPLPGWPVVATSVSLVDPPPPVLGDVDGDGRTDVVWGGVDGYVYVWDAGGTALDGFPIRITVSGRNVLVAVADMDGVPGDEIVASTEGGAIHVLRHDGTEVQGWPRSSTPTPLAPIVTPLGLGSEPCIVVGAGYTIKAFGSNGSTRWTRSIPGLCAGFFAAADLNGDGSNEVVFGSIPGQLVALDSSGVLLWSAPVPGFTFASGIPIAPVVSHRADGTGLVAIATSSTLSLLLPDGTPAGPQRAGAGVPSIADLDDDGHAEIVVATNPDSVVIVYDLGPGSWRAGPRTWTTERGNAARTGSATVPARVPVLDDVPPETVTDLHGTPAGDGVDLAWTVPRDQGPEGARVARYELRFSTSPILEDNFDAATPISAPAPGTAGAIETVRAGGLEEHVAYWFALRSVDRAGNPSPLSNVPSITTPAIPPAAIRDLRVAGGTDSTITLQWTATGDDGDVGRASRCRISIDDQPPAAASAVNASRDIEVAATQDAGGRETVVVDGLLPGRRYWITVYVEDEGGRTSPPSNLISARPGPLAGSSAFAVRPAAQPAHPPVALHWQTGTLPAGNPVRLDIVDVGGRHVRSLDLGRDTEGVAMWDGLDGAGRGVENGVYFARISAGSRSRATRIVLLW